MCRRSESGYGSGRSMKTSTALKTAVFAPMPMPRESTAMAMRPQLRARARRPYVKSWKMPAGTREEWLSGAMFRS